MGVQIEDIVYDRRRPLPTRAVLYDYELENAPGKSIVAIHVSWPPNGATPPHRHGGASVAGVVVQGTVTNKMNDEPTYKMGVHDAWHEMPHCHHRTSGNASETEPAAIIATFVVDTKVIKEGGYQALVVIDEEYRDVTK